MSNAHEPPPYMATSSGTITIYLQGKTYNVDKTHKNYEAIKDALLVSKRYADLPDLVDIAGSLQKSIQATPNTKGVSVVNGQVMYAGEALHNAAVDQILYFLREKFDFSPLVNFLNWLVQNPSKKSLDNLYRFCDFNKVVITPEGFLLLYKKVRDDYMDIHEGRYSNKPGTVVEMPRNLVEDDPNITCSHGLHVASLAYMPHYGGSGSRIVLVKVNPMDVVSVPTDYNNAKMRVCKYEVLSDYTNEVKQEDYATRVEPEIESTTDLDGEDGWPDEDEEDNNDYCFDCHNHIADCECDVDCDESEDDVCPWCGEDEYDCVCEDDQEEETKRN